jgi:glycosyltransferase involved in cell wall biosynthesis
VRIAIVTTSYPLEPGSFAGHFVAAEAKELVAAGHLVTVCTPGFEGERELDGIAVHGAGNLQLFGSPGALPRLSQHPQLIVQGLRFVQSTRRWLREQGPFDRIQAHWLLPCGWPIATDTAAEIEIVCHGSDVELLQRLPGFVTRGILRKVAEKNARLRCVSQGLKRKLVAIDPNLEPRIEVRPAPITMPIAGDRVAARIALGIDSRATLIVIIARLIAPKRVDVALEEIAPLLSDAQTAPQVVVIGDGPERERLQQINANVRFLGELPREQALSWLVSADLLLSASELEGAPTVVREARSLNVPVVCAIAGDVAQWAEQDPGIHLFHDRSEIEDTVLKVLSLRH